MVIKLSFDPKVAFAEGNPGIGVYKNYYSWMTPWNNYTRNTIVFTLHVQ